MRVKNSNFVDYVKIFCRSGKGGAGSAHFLRDKTTAKGGPDGGDGGHGGHIILRGNEQMWTLLHLRYKKHIFAEHGGIGSGNHRHGKDGGHQVIDVPLGTIARDAETGEVLCEITDHGDEFVMVKGGMGGRGNAHFKSPTNQSPRYAQPGIDVIEGWYILELKVLADVGLVGFPNAGKSTLLSVLSSAKPKIANYEFTTLKPNLGIVSMSDYRSFVMADIPGIIEGASEGKGLGHYFLRHIERNSILLYVIPVDTKDLKKEFDILNNELKKYNPELIDKDFAVFFSKSDLMDQELLLELEIIIKYQFKEIPYFTGSSINMNGIKKLKEGLWKILN